MTAAQLFCFLLLVLLPQQEASDLDPELLGDWSLELESKTPAWMSVRENDGKPEVRMRLYVGSDGPHEIVGVSEKGVMTFVYRKNRKSALNQMVSVSVDNGELKGVISMTTKDGTKTKDSFTGKRIPPMPQEAPDLAKVKFGHPVMLFNGKDMSGWRPHEANKKNGWSVIDGLLVNTTPKTDFSATGAFANLRTEDVYEDFWLHIEFLVEQKRNSGIYLRGMYEAQVVDRDSPMQGINGPGAIFGKIAPSKNAGRPGGQWQSYDLTLVNRHITVVLNGEKVIDNQPISAPTAGAILTDPMSPGPIYLQGDHTEVKYRNIYLAPVVSD